MKDIVKVLLIAVTALVVMFGIGWIVRANIMVQNAVFAPQEEQIRHQTFEQSKAFQQGLVQELQNMIFQYEQASPEHKAALASLILRRSSSEMDNLPNHLQTTIRNIKTDYLKK